MSRVVLVVGASSGIGRATAVRLARRGDRLVLVARAPRPLADAAAECVLAGAASVATHPVDVLDLAGLQEVVAATHATTGSIDAVVHSASVVAYGRFDQVPAAIWDRVLETNVLGAANVARAVLPDMRERNTGAIVLLGSVIGEIAVTGMSAYTVSKWALRSLGRCLQLDNRDRPGVRVCVVSLGSVDTPIYQQAANYLGQAGRPPPPVYSAEHVATRVVEVLDRPRKRVNIGAANPLMRLGFALTPGLFDVLVGPLFRAVATARRPMPTGDGNVLAPLPQAEAVGGGHGLGVRVVLTDLVARTLDKVRRRSRRGGRARGS